jgi:orotidine-5'-phosphate decarboxylase
MKEASSLVCVGLDPDVAKMPLSITQSGKFIEDNVFDFLSQVVDITAEHACCYKVQKAFFDQYGQGHLLFNRVIAYLHERHPEIPVFADCKIGDIDNTMLAYMDRLFVEAGVDGVVINPYMGDDVFTPFLQDPKKVALVLVQTSNANATVLQNLVLKNDKKLWEEILDLTLNRWNKNGNMILILSSNSTEDYSLIREKIPQDTPILLAGIGSQGGNPEIMKQVLNANKRGVFVNSSRGILYPYAPSNENWQAEVLKAVIELKQTLNNLREG